MFHKISHLLLALSFLFIFGCKITGTVTEDGVGLEGVTVTLSGTLSNTVVTNGDGAYSFNNLFFGNYTVTPIPENYTFNPASQEASINALTLLGVVKNFEASEVEYCTDIDEDGYGNPASSLCENPELDCNDNDQDVNPDAAEILDGIDNNCNGEIDEGYNSEKDILTFDFPASENGALSTNVIGNVDVNTINVTVPFGTDVTALTPEIAITGQWVSPANGVAADFSDHVIYTVTATDETTKDYTVIVEVMEPLEFIASFSGTANSGVYYYNGIAWNRISSTEPEDFTVAGGLLYLDYGDSGLYKYNNGNISSITAINPELIVSAGSVLYIDFGDLGLWTYDENSLLEKKAALDPENMVAGAGDDAYFDFGSSGIWYYNGTFTQVASFDAEDMVTIGSNLYADCGSNGLIFYNGTDTTAIHTSNPIYIAEDGSTIYAYFSSTGISEYNGVAWTQITTNAPDKIQGGGNILYMVFSDGLSTYDNSNSQVISIASSVGIDLLNVDDNANAYANFSGQFYVYDGSWTKYSTSASKVITVSEFPYPSP